ncbi:MAG: putative PhzF superfamily epimerase YddE/YHI9 [Lentisphaeria bacterium]|jgi:predicted PhzF superfamily epimerase YddE/YHI9
MSVFLPNQNQSHHPAIYSVSSFEGPACEGNHHWVFVNFNFTQAHQSFERFNLQSNQWPQQLSAQLPENVLVFLSIDSASLHCVFFSKGRQVARCGSGSLSAAKILFDEYSMHTPLRVTTSVQTLLLGRQNGLAEKYFYQTATLPMVKLSRFRHMQTMINRKIKTVHAIGGDSDYYLIELYSQKAVRQCSINAQLLGLISKRALIVTAASDSTHWDYVMRYFAPQYGNYEDAATGSANAMLAPYWQTRLLKKKVRGRQLSKQGGIFDIEKCAVQQRVYGRVSTLKVAATDLQCGGTNI